VSVFRYVAPLFKLAGRRWSADDFHMLADLLRPFVPPGGVFADLGGGTGDLGAGLARQLDADVVIVDSVEQMLERVSADPRVSVRRATVHALPFPTAHFDAVLCCDAFHHFRDQQAAATEIARVVRPGGGVMVLDAAPTGPNRVLASFERLLGEPGAFLDPDDLRALFAAHGVSGGSVGQRGWGYLFLGSVDRPDEEH